MRTKLGCCTLIVMLSALSFFGATFSALSTLVEAQQASGKAVRIGYLGNSLAIDQARVEALLHGLRELGWVEGQNLVIEYRWADGNFERLPKLAAELVHLKVKLLFAPASTHVEAARRASSTIPIVFATHGDALGIGHVASLARPGGNITGLSQMQPETNAKALELLKEIMPALSRVAVLWMRSAPVHVPILRAVEATGRDLGLRVQSAPVDSVTEFEKVFEAMVRERAGAVVVQQGPVINLGQQRLTKLALKYRLPTVTGPREYVEAGMLMCYGADLVDMSRRAARYVDRILKGAKPADLPVEQPTKFELVINLKTAKALGLTIPRSILIRADDVIE